MSSFSEIKTMALALPKADRELLAEELVVSLDQSDHDDIHPEWVEEIRQRIADYRNGSAKTIPGKEVTAQIRAVLQDLKK